MTAHPSDQILAEAVDRPAWAAYADRTREGWTTILAGLADTRGA